MNITTVGIDLAKNVFQMQGVDVRGKVALRRQLRREHVARFFVKLPPCLIGMADVRTATLRTRNARLARCCRAIAS